MVEKLITPGSDVVIDFVRYRAGRGGPAKASAMSVRSCRHCGAALLEGENDDDCSSVLGSLIDESCLRIVPRKMRVD